MAINEKMLEAGKKLADSAMAMNMLSRDFHKNFTGSADVTDEDYEETALALQKYEGGLAEAMGLNYDWTPGNR